MYKHIRILIVSIHINSSSISISISVEAKWLRDGLMLLGRRVTDRLLFVSCVVHVLFAPCVSSARVPCEPCTDVLAPRASNER